MSNCNPCNKSILSQTESAIGKTQCTQPCPPEITCVDIIPSNCVFYSGPTLSCASGSTSVNYGVTITSALNTMYQLICQNSTSNTVQITANDTCYGYLASKITSTSLDITITENLGACQKLNIEEKCYTWTELTKGNLGLASGWSWAQSGFERPAVSNVKNCIVRLAGTISKNIVNAPLNASVTIGKLPVAPENFRRFPIVITSPGAIPFIPSMLTISPTGEMTYLQTVPLQTPTKYVLCLDGISFETGTIII